MEAVWEGADALRPFLVEVDALEPFPGNPRRGDVSVVRESLERFGQIRPLLVDGEKVVAGHHVRLAAIELGWTHVAAIPNDFRDDDEARAYLLADNRTHDVGPGYDPQLLVEHLQYLDEFSTLHGTGYSLDDLDDQLAAFARAQGDLLSPLDRDDGKREHRDQTMKELVLIYSPEQLDQVGAWLAVVASREGTGGTSETVYAALELAVRSLGNG